MMSKHAYFDAHARDSNSTDEATKKDRKTRAHRAHDWRDAHILWLLCEFAVSTHRQLTGRKGAARARCRYTGTAIHDYTPIARNKPSRPHNFCPEVRPGLKAPHVCVLDTQNVPAGTV